MIQIRGLTKRYGDTVAVDDLSFDVLPGRVTGFLGPNGAGKSTTMRVILGLDNPTSGVALVNGAPFRDSARPLASVGALLDARAVHGGRSAANHLLCLAQSNGIDRQRVGEALDAVGLQSVARKRAKGFSLGMSQRLGIAAALLGDPQVLMFDEPVNGLDPEGIRWIRDLMKRLAAEGRTVFVSSHLMSEMALTADHLVIIGRGRLIADTTVGDFVRRHGTSYVRVRTPHAQQLVAALQADGASGQFEADGSLTVWQAPAERIGEVAAASGVVLHELSPHESSLEEAFMRLTAGSVEYHAHTGQAEGDGAPTLPWGANGKKES
jgi:ABC-2 type transport system ATP-binding protein